MGCEQALNVSRQRSEILQRERDEYRSQLDEARAFIAWCQAFADNTREAGSLRAKLRDLSPALTSQGSK